MKQINTIVKRFIKFLLSGTELKEGTKYVVLSSNI